MLKLKYNVELKELEKFGFVKIENHSYELPRFSDNLVGLTFSKWTDGEWLLSLANVRNANLYEISERLDTIYDLIQAGLIEKVQKENKI